MMKLLILGSGMYVTGRGNASTGTILSSVIQSGKQLAISEIHILSKRAESADHVHSSIQETNRRLGTDVNVQFLAMEDKAEGWFDSYLDDEGFDAVIVSLPDHLHYSYGKICLEKGIHMLMVKPLTPSLKEAEDLQNTAAEKNCYAAVEFHKRWDESNLYMKGRIKEGALGELLYFDVNYSQRVSIPAETFKSWADKTNIFQYLGVHYVDLIYFMTGAIPKTLHVYGTKKKLIAMGIDTWDSVHVSSVWQGSNGQEFYAHFNLNWIDHKQTTAMSDQRISVVGTEGRIDADQKNRGIQEVSGKTGAQSINPYFSTWIDNGDYMSLNGYGVKSIEQFLVDVDSILNGSTSISDLEKSRPSFNEGLISTAFIEAVNNALATNNQNTIEL